MEASQTQTPTPTYRVDTWAGLPCYTCLRCGYNTVGKPHGITQLTSHLHEIHAAAPVEAPAVPAMPVSPQMPVVSQVPPVLAAPEVPGHPAAAVEGYPSPATPGPSDAPPL